MTMLNVKEWLKNRSNKQFEFILGENPMAWTCMRLSDGAKFYEGQIIKMMLLNIYVIKLHADEIHVDIKMEHYGGEIVELTIEINLLYAKSETMA